MRDRSWEKSKKGKASNRISVAKYVASPHGKEVRRIYQQTIGKDSHTGANARYRTSKKGYICRRLYRKNFTPEEKKRAIIALQEFKNQCYCCGALHHGGKGWHLDHKDRKFRGILCQSCNLAAGMLKDSIERCQQLIAYLERFQCQ